MNNFAFEKFDSLSDGTLELVLEGLIKAEPKLGGIPRYRLSVRLIGPDVEIGRIDLRLGYNEYVHVNGNIGYSISARYRGGGYAGRACRLLAPLALRHGYRALVITSAPDNAASNRVCEKLGAILADRLGPRQIGVLSADGDREKNVYVWAL